MVEEKIEETNDNPGEETPAEQTPQEPEEAPEEIPPKEKETPEKPESPKEEYTDREKRLYARAKKAEEEAKTAKAEVAKSKKPVSEIDAILEVQQATKGLESDEVAELKLRATAKGVSLSEARKDENFALWQTAYKAKVADEQKTPAPSSPGSGTSSKEITPGMKQEEMNAILDEKIKQEADREKRSGV